MRGLLFQHMRSLPQRYVSARTLDAGLMKRRSGYVKVGAFGENVGDRAALIPFFDLVVVRNLAAHGHLSVWNG